MCEVSYGIGRSGESGTPRCNCLVSIFCCHLFATKRSRCRVGKTGKGMTDVYTTDVIYQYHIFKQWHLWMSGGRDASVRIAMGYCFDGGGSSLGRESTSFFSLQRPDRLWSPLNLLTAPGVIPAKGKRPEGEVGHQLPVVQRSRMVEVQPHSPYVFMQW
jgi:hypothetical protein